jgi:hypothetical protein
MNFIDNGHELVKKDVTSDTIGPERMSEEP